MTIRTALTLGLAYAKQVTGEWPTAAIPSTVVIGIVTVNGSSATIPFTAPANNGATITSYTATSSPGNVTGTLTQAGSGTITVSGLQSSTSYTFTVTAINAAGTSATSSASNTITTGVYVVDPLAIYNTLLLSVSSNSIISDASNNNFTITPVGVT